MNIYRSFCFVAIAGIACLSSAQTVVYLTGGGVVTTTGITQFTTTGDQMTGMQVLASFDNGFQDVRTWGATGAGSGGVTGNDGSVGSWSLTESGDSFSDNAWRLSLGAGTSSLRTLTLLGAPGRTVFDRTFNFNEGSSGSAGGKDMKISGPSALSVQATYSLAVALNDDAAVGDIFAKLEMRFLNQAGLVGGSSIRFSQDSDNAKTEIVPEPASLTALGAAMFALARKHRLRHRRRQ